jgi:KTSC domain
MVTAPVSSSSLVAVGYDSARRELEIEFVSGRLYRYFGVPPRAYEALMRAPSKGRHFNEHIRDRYRFSRLA